MFVHNADCSGAIRSVGQGFAQAGAKVAGGVSSNILANVGIGALKVISVVALTETISIAHRWQVLSMSDRMEKAKAKIEEEKKKLKPGDFLIFREGGHTTANFTPRPIKDTEWHEGKLGLSFIYDVVPDKCPFSITTFDTINNSGFLIAVKDGVDSRGRPHVSVRPRTLPELQEWAATRDYALKNPEDLINIHLYTKFLFGYCILVDGF